MRLLTAVMLVALLYSSTIASAKIVFSLKENGIDNNIAGIYIMDDSGEKKTRITQGSSTTRWSPDGRQILINRGHPPEKPDGSAIYLINADGKDIRQLTGLHQVFYDSSPTFFPDGKSILFNRYNKGVRVMDLETNEVSILGDFRIGGPDISPNGKYIVYENVVLENVLRDAANIWIMNADGSNRNPLIPPAADDGLIYDRRLPRWDRYGNKIVFIERRYKPIDFPPAIVAIQQGFHYFIYDLDSKELHELEGIPEELEAVCLDWMDNSRALVFSACKRTLFERDLRIDPSFTFYRYHIANGELSVLAEHLGELESVDWIRDDAHSVLAESSLTTQWGKLKQK